MKHIFLTYGDDKYKESKDRLIKEATEFGFDKIYLFEPKDLSEEFKNKTREVLDHRRGGGYWIWKSYCMKKAMDEAEYGDVIVYMDAGCSLDKKMKDKYYEYIDLVKDHEHSILSFVLSQPFHDTYKWTKKDCFDFFKITPEHPIFSKGQLMAGVVLMIKTKYTVDLINEYYEIAINHPRLFDDTCHSRNYPGFMDHRHDQSVFNILRYLRGTVTHHNDPDNLTGPLQATRLRK